VQHLERHPLSPPGAHFLGVEGGRVGFTDFAEFPRLVDPVNRRSINQWWLPVRPLADALAHEPAAGDLTNGGR
jgi:hypothetical protein